MTSCADTPTNPGPSTTPPGAVALDIMVWCNDYDPGTGACWDDWNGAVCDYENPTSWCYDPCFPDWCEPDSGGPPPTPCNPEIEPCPDGGGGESGSGTGDGTDCTVDPGQCGAPPTVDESEYNRLNREEKKLCWANPMECIGVYHAKNMAEDFSNAEAQADGATSAWNNKYDAMRHAYWNAVMTRALGEERAEVWATAHEWGIPPTDPERCMDMFNNAVGRGVGVAAYGQTYPQMQQTIREMANAQPPQLRIFPGC